MNVAFNRDCLEAMKEFPDGHFDLAVVDPPYGDAAEDSKDSTKLRFHGGDRWDKYSKDNLQKQVDIGTHVHGRGRQERYKDVLVERTGGTWAAKYGKNINNWDVAPSKEYFDELFRISKNQIIWGGNYFNLPPTRCFLIWKKLTISESFSMAMAEYAWTSFNGNAKVFECAPQGNKEKRFHPTQKPIELYDWVFKNYAQDGFKILDTHLGSGSSRIAAWKAGLDFYGYEIDKTYFDLQEQRFEKYSSQVNLFLDMDQTTLFAGNSNG